MVFAVALTWEAYRNEQGTVANQLLATARAIAGVVDGEIEQDDEILKAFAASPALQNGDLASVDTMARRMLPGADRWFVLMAPSGQQLINTRAKSGAPLPLRPFAPGLADAIRTHSRYVTEVDFGAIVKAPVVHIARPVLEDERVKYVLSIGVTPATLTRALNVSRYAPGSIVTVTDRHARIIARSLNADKYVGGLVTPDLVRAMAVKTEGITPSITLEKLSVLTAFSRAECGWTVLIGSPRTALYASARDLLTWSVAGCALLIAIVTLMAAWILRAIVRSVDSLSEDAETIGHGQMPAEKGGGLVETDFVAAAMRRTAELLLRRTRVLEQVNLDNLELHRALSRELEEKSKSEAELERKVEERTASLRQAVTQMEEFSYTVSHDLRSPLRALQGYAEILLEDYKSRLDEAGQEYLLRIQRAAVRMDQLTTDVLDYSRLARAEVTLIPTDLDKIVRTAVEHYDQLQRSAAAVKIESPLQPVMAHEPALMQCLSNLLTNAVKFVKPGAAPAITVRTERRGNRVRIWVEDQGIGVAPEYHANLFRLFERLPTAGSYEGTGIGLAIVRKGAEKMGGTCGVESDGVSGSRFWIELAAVER